jgi:hypothetical protein
MSIANVTLGGRPVLLPAPEVAPAEPEVAAVPDVVPTPVDPALPVVPPVDPALVEALLGLPVEPTPAAELVPPLAKLLDPLEPAQAVSNAERKGTAVSRATLIFSCLRLTSKASSISHGAV